ncbi:hypothetical protein MIZ03_4159 [Rhodoferax lithotrophicus]|uniref:Uncharacterized protein n=1 Tax=Rhodoferax lithotrophicus TaxID=2798804 RepID=A0ABN6DB56_9BURK|nr:hypothetical protein MIZ03_4159 [Rhodoferax sp. MIZ03]
MHCTSKTKPGNLVAKINFFNEIKDLEATFNLQKIKRCSKLRT